MMKNTTIMAALAAAVLLLSACAGKEMVTVTFDDARRVGLAWDSPDSMDIRISVEYPVKGLKKNTLEMIRRQIANAAFHPAEPSGDIAAAAAVYIDSLAKEYRETNEELWEDVIKDNEQGKNGGTWLSWTDNVTGYFSGGHEGLISYVVEHDSYTGGAHGLGQLDAIVLDLRDGSAVNESDLFADGYEESLSERLSTHLPEAFDDEESYEGLFVKQIAPNGNFMVSEDGVTYIYQPYEIGPYSLGTISVTVPWTELEDLLK